MTAGERASVGRRLAAGVVDVLVAAAAGGLEFLSAYSGDLALDLAIAGAVAVLAASLHPIIMLRTDRHAGQTLGKQIFGLKVVAADGRPLDGRAVLGRELIGKVLLGLVPPYALADLAFLLADGERRALHDRIARTTVVEASLPASRPQDFHGFAPPRPD